MEDTTMKKTTRGKRLAALVLVLAIVLAPGVPAFAEGGYAADQSYTQDRSQESVYAVKILPAGEESREALRDRLLAAGFDAYLYEAEGKTVVLCGKFRDMADALACRKEISESVEDVKVFISSAWLPAEAIDAFEAGPQESAPEETAQPATTRTTSSLQDTVGSEVYTVALSTVQDISYAEALVEKMQKAGFDAFIQPSGSSFRVMSGKFHDICNALLYRDCIWSNTDRTDTIIVTTTVAESEIEAFTEDYEKNGLPGPIKDNLEKPTGAFYREKNGQVLAYTVQFSAGFSFSGAERTRDAMSAAGFPAFVYECSRVYEIMAGAFYSREKADAYCQKIKDNTAESDAYVTTAWLPASIVK
ncbi:MAG: SPOR domain-containing protein [Oscillospiraceae bacterium]|nr:SPOR domain-containing protein [Oscillospiraceae bacterium]